MDNIDSISFIYI